MNLGPYQTTQDRKIKYKGNKLFKPIDNIQQYNVPTHEIEARVEDLAKNPMWSHIARINHRINISTNQYFDELGALFTLLPLTTRMISSPGAVYGKYKISYTTDTVPIKLRWFDLEKPAFLAESSQIYLELALLQDGVNHVYAIYNSFRQEQADPTHLSEFHHIEYEGKVTQEKNLEIICNLVRKIVKDLLDHNENDLSYFLNKDDLEELESITKLPKIPTITFKEALEQLYQETGNERYKPFTLKEFGSWEEIKLTEINDGIIGITEFPLLEIPFYHAPIIGKEPQVAENADIIWPGYREIVGSGHRVRSLKELEEKAKIFELPKEDYEPYLQSRRYQKYVESSGFGLGWERFLQGILKMPFIWSVSHFPRVHTTLKP
jgi:aspartyl/asparaginyl-tRNA synthetase